MPPDAPLVAETTPSPAARHWRDFVWSGAIAAGLLLAAFYGFILALDPYGRRTGPGRPPSPIMDINQRYMYPQLARSGLFDAAVFGTSTARLLDPRALDAATGARFANLAINAGTPWEQLQLMRLFLHHVPVPKILILGLDWPWCSPSADEPSQRLTFRSFPPWLYDENPLNDLPHLLNLKTLEIAGRVALNRLGRMPARIRGDGYEVFTPPEESYDLARARLHLSVPAGGGLPAPAQPCDRLPAIAWLGELARDLPAATRLVLLLPPVHAGALPPPGSAAAAADDACKRKIVEALGSRSALVLDYRHRSPLTDEDSNFWDTLHYRLPIAARIVEDIRSGLESPRAAEDDRYRILLPQPGP
ncbi:hypothetical protein [Enterovirga sp.]|uniref:hypothetical protein n=1 Tax=Enterovirga sp. TaxID=2026350 RepID=UPI002C16D4F6|nr:hypothetical protein [Enterovirga sp.]HMO30798.1 hypothetical protein [Enterovirga sp.]